MRDKKFEVVGEDHSVVARNRTGIGTATTLRAAITPQPPTIIGLLTLINQIFWRKLDDAQYFGCKSSAISTSTSNC